MSDESILNKRIDDLEKKLEKVRYNIIMMSFYTDLKIIEGTIHRCKLHGIKIDQPLIDALKDFKKDLYGDKDIFKIGRKYVTLSEKYYAFRKEIFDEDELLDEEPSKEKLEEMLKSYV